MVLNSGHKMPLRGFGTSNLKAKPFEVKEAVYQALQTGYRYRVVCYNRRMGYYNCRVGCYGRRVESYTLYGKCCSHFEAVRVAEGLLLINF